VYVISLAVHLAAGGVLALVPQKKLREVVAIALNEPPPKDEKKAEPPKPQPHPVEHAAHAHHVARAEPAPAAAAPEASDTPSFNNLGLTLDSSSSDGLAVRVAPPPPPPAPVAPPKPKLLLAHKPEPECSDESLHKARPLGVVRPSYTDEARRARVQGRVRIELAVDDQGQVSDARVLDGLGYGLDEAALEAARRLRFAPALRCNRPVSGPFVIAMRFVLGT
jgi:protein TonB